jgi:hypothetical protein
MMVISGILVVVLRYGYRAPLWVWLSLRPAPSFSPSRILPKVLSRVRSPHWRTGRSSTASSRRNTRKPSRWPASVGPHEAREHLRLTSAPLRVDLQKTDQLFHNPRM